MQTMWSLGHALDRLIIGALEGTAPLPVGCQVSPSSVTMSDSTLVALYHQGVVEHAKLKAKLFLSGCMDKSTVHSTNMQLAPFVTVDNIAWWATPQAYPPNSTSAQPVTIPLGP